MHVPFFDLTRQNSALSGSVNEAIKAVIGKGQFIGGEALRRFEEEFRIYLDVPYCLGMGSGTDALYLSLLSLNLEGGEVLVQANTFVSTASSVVFARGVPVFCDIEDESGSLPFSEVVRRSCPTTKAIILVHLYGKPVRDLDQILNFARERDLFVVEDACQAHGADFRGRKVGTFGDIGCFSFYPSKNLGAFGDGGAIVTGNLELFERAKLLHEYGQAKKYFHQSLGVNSRLDTLQAAILSLKLPYLDTWNRKRRQIAAVYIQGLSNLPIKLLKLVENDGNIFHLFVIRTPQRDQLKDFLSIRSIDTLMHYPIPLHMEECFSEFAPVTLPRAEQWSSEVLSLPLFPEMTDEEVDYVVKNVREFFASQ